MNIVDSSGWLEYFADGPGVKNFEAPLSDSDSLIVPTIIIYEVFKVVLRESNENSALQAVAVMQKSTICKLSEKIAIASAKLSLALSLPMADSIILATAKAYDATIWTQDADFEGIKNVRYFPKQ